MNEFLNVGSGQRPFAKPFVNVDCQAKWGPDIIADGADLHMIADNSAKIVVLHHVLEHFGCGEGDKLVRECHRVLAPGGSLIVSVPNLVELFKAFHRGQISEQVYMTNVYGAYMESDADRHRWGWCSGASLANWLWSVVDWTRIRTFDNRQIEGADIAVDFWILSLEAVK